MTRILKETVLSLDEARREPAFVRVVRGIRRPASLASLYRAVQPGLLAVGGQRVALEAVRTPSGLRTSREAIDRFVGALNGYEPGELEESNLVAAGSGNSEAEAVLDRLGI